MAVAAASLHGCQWTGLKDPPQKEAGEIIEDEDTNETVEKIVSWLDARKLL